MSNSATRFEFIATVNDDKIRLISLEKLEVYYGIKLLNGGDVATVNDIHIDIADCAEHIADLVDGLPDELWNDCIQTLSCELTDDVYNLLKNKDTKGIRYKIGCIDSYNALYFDVSTNKLITVHGKYEIDSHSDDKVRKYIMKQSLLGVEGVKSIGFNNRIYTQYTDDFKLRDIAVTPLHRVLICDNYRKSLIAPVSTAEMRVMSKINIETSLERWNVFKKVLLFDNVYVNKSLVKIENIIKMSEFVVMNSVVEIKNALFVNCEVISSSKVTLENVSMISVYSIRHSTIICNEIILGDIILNCHLFDYARFEVHDSGYNYDNRLYQIGHNLSLLLRDEELEIIVDRSLYNKWILHPAWSEMQCLSEYIHPKDESREG